MPINRLIAFIVKPIVTVVVASVSAWLVTHLPGINIPDSAALAESIAQSVGFIVGGYATSKGFDKWIEGWIKHEENQTLLELNHLPINDPDESEPAGDPTVPPGLNV